RLREEVRARPVDRRPIRENAGGDDAMRNLLGGRTAVDRDGLVAREPEHQLVPCAQFSVVDDQEHLRPLHGDPSSYSRSATRSENPDRSSFARTNFLQVRMRCPAKAGHYKLPDTTNRRYFPDPEPEPARRS